MGKKNVAATKTVDLNINNSQSQIRTLDIYQDLRDKVQAGEFDKAFEQLAPHLENAPDKKRKAARKAFERIVVNPKTKTVSPVDKIA